MKKLIVFTAFLMQIGSITSAQTSIAAKDASKHLNETVTITDKIYSTKLIQNSKMVLLDLGGAHPHEYLTVVIKGENRSKFNDKPEEYYKGKQVIVTGKVIDYKGKPEIIVNSPDELKIKSN
jgi:micrococcal nuclease